MEKTVFRMKQLLKGSIPVTQTEPEEEAFLEEIVSEEAKESIQIDYLNVEQIMIPEIKDVKGRLSDIIESIETITGMSVIPLEMAGIAPEVVKLQRHEIFELGGKRYAMSKHVREHVLQGFVDKVVKTLCDGLPFVENLSTFVTYNNKDYKTFALSRAEWTVLLSKFKSYQHVLKVKNNTDLLLEISTEHKQ